jgi:hypothetical protein
MPPTDGHLGWFRSALRLGWFKREPRPRIRFEAIAAVDRPPNNNAVADGVFYFVSQNQKPRWVLFRCPSGCGEVITLSLQKAHYPHWRLTRTRGGRPTLYPSIWRDVGCLSHFWVYDGRIYWCRDTGSSQTQMTSS